MVRIDYAPWGLNPPHIHPRATEIFTVREGTLEDSFIMKGSAIAIDGLSSQNPGVMMVANAVFRSKPMIYGDVLAKTFQVNMTVVDAIQGGM
ncbi:putative germin-like protein 8-1 [Camellia sinensis]|uniref:putative germin-like protein 8-1 n=1 Tax=Camellia sinensis TaxID=4442 RepID=UPI0010361D17|nr:putative germin-like protein 8-1 [Camellia sinensis]